MTYPESLNKLISFIPAEVYAEHEKQITELADAIATDRARLKEAVLESYWMEDETGLSYICHHCGLYSETGERTTKHRDYCIVGQLEEEGE